MRLTDVKAMQNIDSKLGEFGIPEIVPMEHAGKAVADVAMNMLPEEGGRVVVVAGKGNNGGDGFGAARWLAAYGNKVQVFGVGMSKNEALTEYNMLAGSGTEVQNLHSAADLDYCKMSLSKADLIIDALLGTGFTGQLHRDLVRLCKVINGAGKPVLSIDVPTGVDAVTGAAAVQSVRAAVTVTLVRPKIGMLLYPAREYVGKLLVADLGMAPQLLALDETKYYLADREMIRELLPERPADVHKGDNGRVTIVAGSPGFTGAAGLCAKAAVKAGAGLVSLLTHTDSYGVLAAKLDETMVKPLPDLATGRLSPDAVGQILGSGADVLAIGPGLGTDDATAEVVRAVIRGAEVPVILDADALTALSGHLETLIANRAPKILTPHAGEMARLVGLTAEEVNAQRLALVQRYAQQWHVILLLKGAPTLIALPSGVVYVIDTGCSAMATGGSGDVLTGIIAALAAQGLEPEQAAVCGAYLHGLAGSMATGGTPGLAAGEIADNLYKAWQAVYEDRKQVEIVNRGIQGKSPYGDRIEPTGFRVE